MQRLQAQIIPFCPSVRPEKKTREDGEGEEKQGIMSKVKKKPYLLSSGMPPISGHFFLVSGDAPRLCRGATCPSPACTIQTIPVLPRKVEDTAGSGCFSCLESRWLCSFCIKKRHSNRHAHIHPDMSATCVQRLNDSRSPAIHISYRS